MTPGEVKARAAAFAAKHPHASEDSPDEGEVLARVPRSDGTEVRVSLHRFRGKDYLRVVPWQAGRNGVMWPVRGKGVALRPNELPAVVTGLATAMERMDSLVSAKGRRRDIERAEPGAEVDDGPANDGAEVPDDL